MTVPIAPPALSDQPFLTVRDLHVEFAAQQPLFGRYRSPVRAVNGVSFSVPRGQTLGLVGESGAGKSTAARAILKLVQVQSGQIVVGGQDVTALPTRALDGYRRQVQVVFQDPYSALNPSHVVGEIVGELVTHHRRVRAGRARDEIVADLLQQVGLGPHLMERLPGELSGGQRQRVAIARALAVEPRLIVCDEPTSALDVSIQSQIINLLEDLQARKGLTYLFITHNLAVARHISHTLGVMYLGYLVEMGPTERVYTQPAHPYTAMLLAANPVPDPVQQRQRAALRQMYRQGVEPPSPTRLPPGCPFANRCPLVMDICRRTMPAPSEAPGGGMVRCHAHSNEAAPSQRAG
ncbi:MAG: ABC transporter ATP-binding protein [Anaerolineae bacterium]|nr:ABC transporter ATP-binding protein [Anaerolineae bacterium]